MTNILDYVLNLKDNLSGKLGNANAAAKGLEATLGSVKSALGVLGVGFAVFKGIEFVKEGVEKLICQKQAYVRFNDNMIKNSDRVDLEIKTRNYNSDRDNKNNFESIGINEKDFLGKELKKKIIIEDEKIKNTVNNNNDNIYGKYEISKLRKKFISSCLKIIDNKIKNYEENLMQQCQKIKYLD